MTTKEESAGRRREREKERYYSDPEYRAKRKQRCARRHAERYRTDEAYRLKLQAIGRKKRNPKVGEI